LFYSNQPRLLDQYMRAQGFDTPTAAVGRTMTLPLLRMRLDGLYVRALEVRQVGVRHSVRDSDHLPVWADFVWPQAAARTHRSQRGLAIRFQPQGSVTVADTGR
jgi:hypothetical protein